MTKSNLRAGQWHRVHPVVRLVLRLLPKFLFLISHVAQFAEDHQDSITSSRLQVNNSSRGKEVHMNRISRIGIHDTELTGARIAVKSFESLIWEPLKTRCRVSVDGFVWFYD